MRRRRDGKEDPEECLGGGRGRRLRALARIALLDGGGGNILQVRIINKLEYM